MQSFGGAEQLQFVAIAAVLLVTIAALLSQGACPVTLPGDPSALGGQ